MLRFGDLVGGGVAHTTIEYCIISILIVLGWCLSLAIYGSRAPHVVGAGPEEFRRVWTATLANDC